MKADYDISGFSSQAQVLLQAFKTYGIVLADNGSDWYVSGSPSESWDNDQLHELDALNGSDFEAVDTSGLMVSQDSAATNQSNTPHVYSIKRMDTNPTSSSTFRFQVYFSEPVTHVDTADFTLTATGGITGETISNITGSGLSYIVTATINSGYGDLHLDMIDNNTILDEENNPLGGPDIGDGDFSNGEYYTRVFMINLSAIPQSDYDGWILEKSETSNKGGTLNKNATILKLGDNAANKQYRSILSFDTSSLPDNAVITSVTLKFKYTGISGTNPFKTHGNLLVDVRKGAFQDNSALQLGDFSTAASKNQVLSFTNAKVDNWYSQLLSADGFQFINLEGVTQFRLRFTKDDNHDFGADFLKLYSSNAVEEDRPQLIIEYFVP